MRFARVFQFQRVCRALFLEDQTRLGEPGCTQAWRRKLSSPFFFYTNFKGNFIQNFAFLVQHLTPQAAGLS